MPEAVIMKIEKASEDEFFNGLNQRIAELAGEIASTANKISDNPDSSTYHIDSFMRPLKIMRKLQKLRDKARAFKENEDEDVVYFKKLSDGEKPEYYYLPKSQYDRSRLPEIIEQMDRTTDTNLGYIG